MSARDDRADDAGGTEPLPEVLFLDDVAKLLRCSPSTIKRRLRAQVFPVAPLPGIDKRPRWSKAALLEWIAVGGSGGAVRGRGRRTA
ncbi:MAG: helix-turn-helix domain-containing protein [Acidobacteria bacterium]|nr:helix-turn-helix domain-containing protein [Acidobacteriota bacterium]